MTTNQPAETKAISFETRKGTDAAPTYTHRAHCACGYRSNWSQQWKAEEQAANHVCYEG